MSNDGRHRENAISDIFVDTSRAQHAFERIDELMARGWERNFCRALLMLGPARCGKTHIITEWTRRRSQQDNTFKAVITEVPSACTLKGMAAQLLSDLGDPDPGHGTENEMTRRLHAAAEGYSLIIIDEVQRLIDERTFKVKNEVANWLTNILNRRVCPLLFVGERHAEHVFQGNMYLEGRTLGQVLIDPYDWNDTPDRAQFRVFLKMIESQLGVVESSDLSAVDTAHRIHAFSGGRIGQATLLIDEARSLAFKRGRPKITHDLLAEAVDLLRVGSGREKANPFLVVTPITGGDAPTHVRDIVMPKQMRRGNGCR